jgi:tetratricopeptide (TPR) repeat protein
MLAVLDEWVGAMPNSYRARMIRGMFRIRMGQYYRGDGYAITVSSGSWGRMRKEMELARADLDAALEMFDRDPEVFGSMGTISRYMDEGQAQAERYYAQAVAVQPLSLSARIGRMTGALPKWGGSWESVDAVLAECEALSPQFPLIMIVKREAERQMGDRSPAHERALSTSEKKREWAEPYIGQLERNPGDPLLMTNAAFFLGESDSFAEAETLYRTLGDTYHEGTNFDDLLQYNNMRAYVYAAVASKYPQGEEIRRRAAEALEISPDHYYTNHIYGMTLLRDGNHEAAARHFEVSRNVNKDYPWSAIGLAECAETRGDRAAAVRFAKQAIDADTMPGAQEAGQTIIERNS